MTKTTVASITETPVTDIGARCAWESESSRHTSENDDDYNAIRFSHTPRTICPPRRLVHMIEPSPCGQAVKVKTTVFRGAEIHPYHFR